MRSFVVALVMIFGPISVAAQDWAVRLTDERLDAGALFAAVEGRTLTFFDDGRSEFSSDGSYAYTFSDLNGGSSQVGLWRVSKDGLICIAYRNGRSRCDMYVRADGRLVVLTEDGGRYPVRSEG